MKVILVLLMLIFIRGEVYSDGDQPFCTEQPDSIRVEGGSVTIPCHFSYPNHITPSEVRVYWRHARGGRCAQNEFIYNHTEKWTHGNYAGRISMEGKPELERTTTIRIQQLKKTDGPMFCCRISLFYNGNKQEQWQNPHGTYIKFKDQFSVEQPDVVPAVMGEDISIPCAVHYMSPDDIEEIVWRFGTSDVCSDNGVFIRWNKENITQNVERWTLQKSENIFSLHIRNVITPDSGQYCCGVKTNRGNQSSSAHGTQVVIAALTQNDPGFTVTQSGIISATEGESVTINCSYTVPPDKNLLWSGVFWRVGSPKGPFTYHPSDLMVDSSYRGRTKLSGQADLQIKGVQNTDHTAYYCFVMLKFCTGNNKYNSILRYGIGTQLDINGNALILTGIMTGVGILILLVVLCIILFILKKRGVICNKKESVKSSPSSMNQVSEASRNSDNVQTSNTRSSSTADSPQETGGTIYAHLNMKVLHQNDGRRNKGDQLSSDDQVLYAAVKPTTDQVIYSTVR